jgi:MscS family membrane protein
MATFFIGQNIFDLNLTALLASAGVLGLACALAAKDTVSNFFGTLVIIADAPFKTGDRIECGQVCGIVKNVGMRSTRLITDDESVCTIPNSMLTNAVLMQRNRRGHFKRIIDLTLTYDTTPEQIEMAIAILHQLMDDFHGKDQKGFEPRIFFSGFGAYSLNIRAIIFFKTESFLQEEKFLHELNHAILKQFNAANLEFAYPTQTLYFSDQNNTK